MRHHGLAGGIALLAALGMAFAACGPARAFDDARYPDWKGQWLRAGAGGGNPPFDPSKPSSGRAEQAPLTPEYQALFEANLADQASGRPGLTTGWSCHSLGMPGIMTLFAPMEILVHPETTYILIDRHNIQRRIFTDGRSFPADIEPSYNGYSIGHWEDTDGDGRYDLLEVETRGFKGPRYFDASGIPLHRDNESVLKERLYPDKSNPNMMHDEITVFDHALTRPWTVTKNYRRDPNPRPVWLEDICAEDNPWVEIGGENYMLSADGVLMPSRKDQPAPDLRYFSQTRK
jgi:hypothetical protein